jgi:hypothetical protein
MADLPVCRLRVRRIQSLWQALLLSLAEPQHEFLQLFIMVVSCCHSLHTRKADNVAVPRSRHGPRSLEVFEDFQAEQATSRGVVKETKDVEDEVFVLGIAQLAARELERDVSNSYSSMCVIDMLNIIRRIPPATLPSPLPLLPLLPLPLRPIRLKKT